MRVSQVRMPLDKLTAGLEVSSVRDLRELLDEARGSSFDFVCIPLFHPRCRRDAWGVSDARDGLVTRSDFEADSRTWTTCVVGKISEWLEPCSSDPSVRRKGELAMKQELAWATHLAVPAVLLPSPPPDCANYARILHQVASEPMVNLQLWVRVPLTRGRAVDDDDDDVSEHKDEKPEVDYTVSNTGDAALPSNAVSNGPPGLTRHEQQRQGLGYDADEDPWETWNRLRIMCEHVHTIGVALELTEDLPTRDVLKRWLGEPIKAVILPTTIFLTNKKGYPVLSRAHQAFLQELYGYKIQVLVRGRARHPEGYPIYLQYLEHMRQRLFPLSQQERFESPYYDFLQAPLQPLMDNLESQTYETFEKDPVKYARYEDAVLAALQALPSAEEQPVVMVVGAGRGPLVRASLQASARARKPIRCYAVEKNPNAVITLRNLVRSEGWTNVTVVATDMRAWDAPEKAEILVSELLGSFGDNELSPECLDGAQRFLKPGGMSIPYEYTSYLAPLAAPKLWREVSSHGDMKHLETAYVVRLHNVCQLAEAKPCFRFEHPNNSPIIDNSRYLELSFVAEQSATVHGLAGYFEAKLYADITISIVPQTFSTGMFSWFPLYIPLRTPVYAPKGCTIVVHMWRNVSSRKVWYEWSLTSPSVTPIHNPNGRSYWIGL